MRKLLFCLMLALPGMIFAGTIFPVAGSLDPALSSAIVSFTYTPGGGLIDVAITNTSPFDARITAFAFNVPSEVTGFSGFSGPANWSGAYGPDNIDTPQQLGLFDMAGLTGNNFSGGSPNDGIPTGSTFNYQFVLSGNSLGSLTEDSFLGLLSAPDGGTQHNFAVRFQRVGPQGTSDVGVPLIPEPATFGLLGVGLALLGIRRLRLPR